MMGFLDSCQAKAELAKPLELLVWAKLMEITK